MSEVSMSRCRSICMAWESVLFPGVVIPWSIISEGRCSETETRGEKFQVRSGTPFRKEIMLGDTTQLVTQR